MNLEDRKTCLALSDLVYLLDSEKNFFPLILFFFQGLIK